MAKSVTYVIQIRRGDMRLNYPLTPEGLAATAADLAQGAATGFVALQFAHPDRVKKEDAIKDSPIPLVLKVPDRDNPLRPEISLRPQLEGLWKPMDTQELGEEGLTDITGQCSFVILDLVDSLRAV